MSDVLRIFLICACMFSSLLLGFSLGLSYVKQQIAKSGLEVMKKMLEELKKASEEQKRDAPDIPE